MNRTITLLALGAALRCAGVYAQPAADVAAGALVGDLRPLSLVAATAALYYDRTGGYPSSAFELLGSSEAERTGLRGVQFADLAVDDAGVAYRISDPGPEARTERSARVDFEHRPDSAQHIATFEVVARRESDAGGGRVPLVVADDLHVRVAQGRLCLASARLAALPDAAAFRAAAPNFGDREALTVSFDGPGGRRVAAATVPDGGGPP